MNILQAGKLNRAVRRSKINRLLIFLLIIGLAVTTVHDNLKIKDLQKQIKNSKIIVVEKEMTIEDYMNEQPPKITDVRPLE